MCIVLSVKNIISVQQEDESQEFMEDVSNTKPVYIHLSVLVTCCRFIMAVTMTQRLFLTNPKRKNK